MKIKLIIWKLRFAWYMWRRSSMRFWWCYECAGYSIENDPDCIWEDGPEYYAAEEMACWSD